MKAIISLLVAAFAGFGIVPATAQTKNPVGAYQACAMACETIQIRGDHTFEQVLDGDLYNNERTLGKWTSLGRNRIKAVGPKPGGPLEVQETPAARDNFQVLVTDFVGATLPRVEITGTADTNAFRCITNEAGYCEIPKCKSFTLVRQAYTGTYTVNHPRARVFQVTLSMEQMPDHVIDDVWVMERGVLYRERGGKIDRSYGLRRIDSKQERKIFSSGDPSLVNHPGLSSPLSLVP